MQLADERAAIVEYCLKMQADDLTVGTSGNLSVRSGDLIAITPSGVDYGTAIGPQGPDPTAPPSGPVTPPPNNPYPAVAWPTFNGAYSQPWIGV